jgi:hypothetical protein
VEEGGEFGEAEGEAFGGGSAEGDAAKFAAGAGGFAVEVEVGVGDGEDFGGVGEVADETEHGEVLDTLAVGVYVRRTLAGTLAQVPPLFWVRKI